MTLAIIVYVLGWLLIALVGLMLLPVGLAVAKSEGSALDGFVLGAILAGFVGGTFVAAFGGRAIVADRKHALAILICAWTCVPIFAAVPFFAATPIALHAAIFEAVSAFTTTGASVFPRLAEVPQSLILWRALLQWAGGLLTLVSAIAILLPLYGAEGFGLKGAAAESTSGSASKQPLYSVRIILPLYASLTVLCLISLLFSGIPAFDALCLAFSTVSTGGFMPRDGTIALYGSTSAEFALTGFMFLGSVSIFWTYSLVAGRRSSLTAGREPLYVGVAFVIGGLLLTTLLWLRFPGLQASWLEYLSVGMASAASLISTTGFLVSGDAFGLVPFMLLIVVCAIGAGRLSTAGGIKVSRLAMMLWQSFNELNVLLFPHGIHASVRGSGAFRQVTIGTIWALFFLTILVLALLILLLVTTGIPFEGALLAAVTALSNAGPIYESGRLAHLSADVPAIWEMTPFAHLFLSAAMILGRVELLAVVSLIRLLLQRE